MSQENVEIVRSYYEAVGRLFRAYWEDRRSAVERVRTGDLGADGAKLFRHLHPDAVWRTALTGVVYRGFGDMAVGFDELVEAARTYRVDLKEVTDLGGRSRARRRRGRNAREGEQSTPRR